MCSYFILLPLSRAILQFPIINGSTGAGGVTGANGATGASGLSAFKELFNGKAFRRVNEKNYIQIPITVDEYKEARQ